MGHLTRIANAVVHNMEKGPMQAQISDVMKGTACSSSSAFSFFFSSSSSSFSSPSLLSREK